MNKRNFDKDGWGFTNWWMHRIHFAAKDGDVEALQAELKKGVDVELRMRDETKQTPLMLAADRGKLEAMKLLLAHKASVEATDSEEWTALHFTRTSHLSCAELLLDHKADIDKHTQEGGTPLMLAALFTNEPLVKLLLSRKANTELRDEDGEAALDMAVEHRKWAVVQLLLPVPEAPPTPFPKLQFSGAAASARSASEEGKDKGSKKRKKDDDKDESSRRKKKGKTEQAGSRAADKDGDKQMAREKS